MSRLDQLNELKLRLEAQAGALPLTQDQKDIIHAEGSPTAEVMMIGEAPGQQETVEGRPFVGRSGKLLRKVFTEAGLPENAVFISNIVKARPPENRDPTPAEILAYKPFLDEEIEIIKPLLIVTLGRYSMQKFLPSAKISQVHGCLQKVIWNGTQRYVLPMYHPAAGLRSTTVLGAFKQDFEKVVKEINWIKEQEQEEFMKKV